MNIGEHVLTDEDNDKVNKILTDFFNAEVKILNGDVPNVPGRTIKNGQCYRLEVSNGNHVGVKLKFNAQTDFDNEIIVNEARSILKMPSFCVTTISGFPINGLKWRKGWCLLSDWGKKGTRINLEKMPSTPPVGKEITFLQQLGYNAAFCFLLGLWDREQRNFVWDTNEGKIISIDHETLSRNLMDQTILSEISKTIKRFYSSRNYNAFSILI